MKWTIEYFEQQDSTQPAEVFEDVLDARYPKLAGKLLRIAVELRAQGYRLGGGYIEKCHDYNGLWEMRVIHNDMLARELFGFEGERIVLLHGYVKHTGQPASERDLKQAFHYWMEYLRSRRISPEQEDDND